MVKLKNLIVEEKYEYGCLMAMLPQDIGKKLYDFGKNIISDDLLYLDPFGQEDYGREKELHTTIKFGFTKNYNKEEINRLLIGTKPFYILIKNIDVFENDEFDVIKFNVDGEELKRLRTIFDKLPNIDKYKEYHPHITLAYVHRGIGKKFKNKNNKFYSRIPIYSLKYSFNNGEYFFKL